MSSKPSPHISYYISQPSFIALMCDAQITGENCLEGWDDTAGSNAGYHNTQLEAWQRKRHLSTQQRHLSTHAMYISMQPRTFTITTMADIKIETQDIFCRLTGIAEAQDEKTKHNSCYCHAHPHKNTHTHLSVSLITAFGESMWTECLLNFL